MLNKILVNTQDCDYCDKKATHVYIKQFLFDLKIRPVCKQCGRARFFQ